MKDGNEVLCMGIKVVWIMKLYVGEKEETVVWVWLEKMGLKDY